MKPWSRWVVASSLGTFLEYFDYTLYGFSIPLIAELFFPSDNQMKSQWLAWSAFSVSFLVRPLGAMWFGHYGDRWGRRTVLTRSILLMAFFTTLLGLLPTHQQIGGFASALLILCRLMQGVAISAEYNGNSIYLLETATHYPGFYAAISPFASGLGMVIAALFVLCFMQASAIDSFDKHIIWRVPFISAGILVGGIGIYLRKHLPETPAFLHSKLQQELLLTPLVSALKYSPRYFLISIVLSAYTGTATYTLLVFTASYLETHLAVPANTALWLTALVGLIESVFSLGFGWLSDKINRILLLFMATCLMALLAIPVFKWLIAASSVIAMASLLGLLACLLAAFDGPFSSFLPRLFPTAYRYSATAVSFNLGGAVIGGSAPFWLTWLMTATQSLIVPGIYLAAFAAISVILLMVYVSAAGKRSITR